MISFLEFADQILDFVKFCSPRDRVENDFSEILRFVYLCVDNDIEFTESDLRRIISCRSNIRLKDFDISEWRIFIRKNPTVLYNFDFTAEKPLINLKLEGDKRSVISLAV